MENRYLGFQHLFSFSCFFKAAKRGKVPRKIGFPLKHFFLLSLGHQNEEPIVSLGHSLCRERERERGRATQRARDGEREREGLRESGRCKRDRNGAAASAATTSGRQRSWHDATGLDERFFSLLPLLESRDPLLPGSLYAPVVVVVSMMVNSS